MCTVWKAIRSVLALHQANTVCWMQSNQAWQFPRPHHSLVKMIPTAAYCKHLNKYPHAHTHTHTGIHIHTIQQARKLHSITVMPQREVEMDGHCYEWAQGPSFPWASVSLGQPVSCLSPWQPHFPSRKKKKIKRCEFTMDWKIKENMQSRLRCGKFVDSIQKERKTIRLFWFVLIDKVGSP